MKSPHSKYPYILTVTVMNSGGYLGMPIPTIKHDNLNIYERILTADHESWRRICTINYIEQLTYRPILLPKKKRKRR